MKLKLKLALAVLGLLSAGMAQAALISVALEDVTNGGGFFANVTFEDVDPGVVEVTADIADPINMGLTKGDILGLGMQIDDESLLGGISATNDGTEAPTGIITGTCFDANNCNLFTGGAGSPGTGFDIVIALGYNGEAAGFVQTLSFQFQGGDGFDAMQFADQLVGMRVQSIEGTSYGEDSSKLIGSGGSSVPEPGPLALLGASLLGMGLLRVRRRST